MQAPRLSLHRFTATRLEPRETWPASVGKGLDVQVFGVGGVAREQAVTLVAGARAQPLLCLRLLGSPREEAAPADRPDRRPLGGLGLEPLRAGLLAGRAGGHLPRLLLPRPPPRPGRRGRARTRPRPTFTGGGRWRRSTSSTWSRPPWAGRPPTGSAGFSRPNTATIPCPARRRRHPPVRLDRRGTPRHRALGRLPAG